MANGDVSGWKVWLIFLLSFAGVGLYIFYLLAAGSDVRHPRDDVEQFQMYPFSKSGDIRFHEFWFFMKSHYLHVIVYFLAPATYLLAIQTRSIGCPLVLLSLFAALIVIFSGIGYFWIIGACTDVSMTVGNEYGQCIYEAVRASDTALKPDTDPQHPTSDAYLIHLWTVPFMWLLSSVLPCLACVFFRETVRDKTEASEQQRRDKKARRFEEALRKKETRQQRLQKAKENTPLLDEESNFMESLYGLDQTKKVK